MVTRTANPSGSNIFNESWRTSYSVIKCTAAKVVVFGISDTLSVSAFQRMPRILAGAVESAVFSLCVIKLNCGLFDTHDLRLSLASDIMSLA